MHTKAIFPGSFDPFHKGHEDIVKRALALVDELIIAVGTNTSKSSYFTLASRIEHIASIFENESRVQVLAFEGLTSDFCKQNKVSLLLRGLRDVKDFEYERSIAFMNKEINKDLESLFLLTDPKYLAINSSIVREIKKSGGIIDSFVTKDHLLVI